MEVSDDAELGEDPRVFQVAVRDGSRGVVDAHQALLDFSGEGHAPQVGLAARVKVDSAHSRFCCVGGSKEGGLLRDNFCQVRGALTEAGSELRESVEVVFEGPCNLDPSVTGAVQGVL